MVEGVEVLMEVDTGASISIMSESTFKDTWKSNSPPLQASRICVKTYTGEALDVLGSIDVEVGYETEGILAGTHSGRRWSYIVGTGLAAKPEAKLGCHLSHVNPPDNREHIG